MQFKYPCCLILEKKGGNPKTFIGVKHVVFLTFSSTCGFFLSVFEIQLNVPFNSYGYNGSSSFFIVLFFIFYLFLFLFRQYKILCL